MISSLPGRWISRACVAQAGPGRAGTGFHHARRVGRRSHSRDQSPRLVLDGEVDGEGEAPLSWLGAGNGDPPATEQPASFRISSKVVLGSVWSLLRPSSQPVTGTLALTTTGTATAPRLEAVRATGTWRRRNADGWCVHVEPRRRHSIRLEDGRVHLDGFRWKGPDSELKASGALGLVDGVDGTMQLDGDASLGLLTLFIPARVDGRARFNLEVSGFRRERWSARFISRTAPWSSPNGASRWRTGRHPDGRRRGDRGARHPGQFNGGDATVEGRLPFRRNRRQTASQRVSGARFLDVPKGLRASWTPISSGRGKANQPAVRYRHADRAPYREPVTELARLASHAD